MRSGFRTGGVALAAVALVLAGMQLADANGGGDSPTKPKPLGAAVPARAKAAGVAANESTFVPITPCRAVDTRAGGGRIGPAGRSFHVAGTADFPAQGGTSGGCRIPPSATAVAANLVAVLPPGSGFLRAYPAGQPAPSASVLNYQTATLANGLTLAVRPGSGPGLTVTASNSTQIIVDVTGYYAPQIDAYLYAGGASIRTARVLSTAVIATGEFRLTIDSDVTDCAAQATVDAANGYARAVTSGTLVSVRTWTLNTSAQAVPTTLPVNVTVTC